jgi:Zn-dependent protease with chaperone function
LIAGQYYDAQQARPTAAELVIDAQRVVSIVSTTAGATDSLPLQRAALRDVEITERLGNVPRRVLFPGGAVFETTDNAGVDAVLAEFGRDTDLVHWMESRWHIAVGSLVAIIVVSFLFIQYGVPAAASAAARVLPTSIDRSLGSQSLGILDRSFLDPSQLPEARQRQLRQRFNAMTAPLDDGHDYQLELRAAPRLGPNALALPSGIVVLTDELVALAEHDEELVAVLAHEIGHVRGRHALRQLFQSTGVAAIALALFGDVSSISALLSAVPALLEAKHSRDFEREADQFAKEWLRSNNIPEKRFDDILCRMERKMGGDGRDSASAFLSTHPATGERARCVAAP